MISLARLLVLASLLLSTLNAEASQPEMKCASCGDKYRKYIENTTWVVPPATLLAYSYVNGAHVAVSDQTVWVIRNWDNGYFFGDAFVSINQVPAAHMSLVGSITPSGDVFITFYPLSGSLQTSGAFNGIGKFDQINGTYVFTMQMNSAENNLSGLSHWSYMESVGPRDPYYKNLPGENMTVAQFINQF